jgi:hypothetical protein
MMLARYVIDILKHTTSTCIVGFLVFSIVNGGLRLMCLMYMDGTYLSFIDISYDVLLNHICWISWCMHLAYGWISYWDM